MRTFLSLMAILCWVSAVAAGDVPRRHTVDLDAPGTIEAVRAANPSHYDRIVKIIEGVLHQPDPTVPRWAEVNFNARDVTYTPVVMTSHPPKRRLSFILDDTRYETVVLLTNIRGTVTPAR